MNQPKSIQELDEYCALNCAKIIVNNGKLAGFRQDDKV